ncbi:hypothetical protein BC830DRAFT_1141529 [Chytriomyces sp. MP71]|nr:hypothetical protein BC830DRAFT_1141529 [Chytriomyces sp. MP71]
METIPTVLIQDSAALDMNTIQDNSLCTEGKFREVESSAVTLTSASRAASAPNIIHASAIASASSNLISKSTESVASSGSGVSVETVTSLFSVKRSSESKGSSDIFAGSTPEIHRTGWDFFGRVEDGEDEPMRRLAGLKLKYRYPVPSNVRDGATYSGIIMTRQWSSAAPLQKWKKRFMIVKENKAYLLKGEGDRTATAVIKLDDCLINPTEFHSYSHSFWLTPPPGAINETNEGREFQWIIMVKDEATKVEWIGAFMKAAVWKENQIARAGLVPQITVQHPAPEFEGSDTPVDHKCISFASSLTDVAPDTNNPSSPVITSGTTSSRSSSLNMDTIFPFTSPDITTAVSKPSSRNSSLKSQEALAMICASNARFFKNGGFKIDGAAGGSPPKHASGGTGRSSTNGPTMPAKNTVRRKTDTDIQVQRVQAPVVKNSTCEAVVARSGIISPDVPKSLPRRQTSPTMSHRDRMSRDRKLIQPLNAGASNAAPQKRQSMDSATQPANERPEIPGVYSMEM